MMKKKRITQPACLNFDSKKMSKQNNNKKQQPQQQNPSSSLHLYSLSVAWKKWSAENVHAVLYNLIKKSSFYLNLCVFCTNYRTKVHLKMVHSCLIWGWWCSGGFFFSLAKIWGEGMMVHSLPALFFLKWRSTHEHQFHFCRPGSVYSDSVS